MTADARYQADLEQWHAEMAAWQQARGEPDADLTIPPPDKPVFVPDVFPNRGRR